MELVDFLRERLDEEAALAEAASPGPWHVSAESDEVLAADDITVADGFALSGRQLRATTTHIARHDPARVLAEVEAKRAVVDFADTYEGSFHASQFLPKLAAIYRTHPDFDRAWLEG